MLTHSEVILYLLRHGLITERQVIDGEVRIVDISRRNHNFKVELEHGGGFLLKHAGMAEGVVTVAHEAEVYALLRAGGWHGTNGGGEQSHRPRKRIRRALPLAEYVPQCIHFDASEGVLVLDLMAEAESYREYHSRTSRFPAALSAALGDALGALHRTPVGPMREEAASPPAGRLEPAWVLSLHRPNLRMLHEISSANLELIQLVQGADELCQRIDAMRDTWQATALIHFDLKWENCIVTTATASGHRRVQVVDWELAGMGDPDWDVGTVFAEYLSFWLLSIPLTGEDPPDRFLELARFPLARMQPAMRAFWRSYTRRMGLDGSVASQHLLRATRYCAARLIHAGFEQSQTSSQLTANVVCTVQLALNMLRWPQEAVVHLLGIPLEGEGPR